MKPIKRVGMGSSEDSIKAASALMMTVLDRITEKPGLKRYSATVRFAVNAILSRCANDNPTLNNCESLISKSSGPVRAHQNEPIGVPVSTIALPPLKRNALLKDIHRVNPNPPSGCNEGPSSIEPNISKEMPIGALFCSVNGMLAPVMK